jgi:PIN domain nuclease of toxin-antitoxin system
VALLLDTHTVLWWLEGDQRLSKRAYDAILAEEEPVYVSAASAWEIATKYRLGKLSSVTAIKGRISSVLGENGLTPLDVTLAHGEHAGLLDGPPKHTDPFDRMLIAQALMEGLTLVSNEQLFDRYGVDRLW